MSRQSEHPNEQHEEHPNATDAPAAGTPPAGQTPVEAPVQPPARPEQEPTPLVGDA